MLGVVAEGEQVGRARKFYLVMTLSHQDSLMLRI